MCVKVADIYVFNSAQSVVLEPALSHVFDHERLWLKSCLAIVTLWLFGHSRTALSGHDIEFGLTCIAVALETISVWFDAHCCCCRKRYQVHVGQF